MKRKMIGAAAAYMAGLFFASFFTVPVGVTAFAALSAAVVLIGKRYGFKACDHILMAVFFAAALTVFNVYTSVRYDSCMKMDGKSGSFKGKVVSAEYYSREYCSYIVDGKINGDISAKISFFSNEVYAFSGDIITVESCTFSRQKKDYLFDSERYYKADSVFLSLNDASAVSVIHTDQRRFGNIIAAYRERIMSDFRSKLGEDSGEFLSGMVFGEKKDLDKNVKTALYRSGIGHMLAVSGLHVSIAIFFLMTLLKICHVNKFVSFAVMEAMLIFIIAMANYPISAIRAAIMMNFLYAAGLFRRQNDTFNSLAGAVLLICAAQPYVLYDTGFILSVAGTFGIGVFAPYMIKELPRETALQKLAASFLTMLCTSVCVLPFSLLYFDETSLISPLTNIIIVPLCSVSVVIGLTYSMTAGAIDLLSLAKIINEIILSTSDVAARIRFTHFSCGSETILRVMMISVVTVVLVAAVFRNRRYICIAVTAAFVFLFIGSSFWYVQRSKNVMIAVLGSGNNTALVISSNGSASIIDVSGHYRSADYVRKYLTSNGIDAVDTVMLMDKQSSSFSSYFNDLGFTDIGKWLITVEDDISVRDHDITLLGETADIDMGKVSVSYADGVVCVSGHDVKICFSRKADKAFTDSDLIVICGNEPEEHNAADNTLFINGNNNFEIELSESGSIKIRRL